MVVRRLVVLLLVELRRGELVHVWGQLRGQIGRHYLVIEGRHHLPALNEGLRHVGNRPVAVGVPVLFVGGLSVVFGVLVSVHRELEKRRGFKVIN